MSKSPKMHESILKKCNISNPYCNRPVFPPYLLVIQNNLQSKGFYKTLLKVYENLKLKQKWRDELNIEISNSEWRKIYKICFKLINRNDLIWFQYRIVQRILGTKAYLFKIKKKTNEPFCVFCKTSSETLNHLFVFCPVVSSFWKNLS